ncbi:phosphate regulon sensor histidine kinase PhoR [Betaproteobacteria bacterium]|nr:phosphate regulon sensor histidine kinase PhoR [Betaproteobacteria bacterium]GHT97985.1 phosphate regulon sensor histidine kinase PhoR [Betaproteobacteria bacterium]GHU11863.1 phosphate regulon sensor histidine kinase PhoR [Betaproteobacteria bacterium]GHU18722.1 phosphate regulon sensor histidine kinase PhoR [Betaproteobacteria bacterium]
MPVLFSRLFFLFLFMGAGAGIANLAGWGGVGTSLGAGAGGVLWLGWDSWLFLRLLDGLCRLQEEPEIEAEVPPRYLFALGGETVGWVYRLLRQKSIRANEQRDRLEFLLAVLFASPNGVILLDGKERIEWFNRRAIEHYGQEIQQAIGQPIIHFLRDPAFVGRMTSRDFEQAVTLDSPVSTGALPLRLSVRIYPCRQDYMMLLSQDITQLEQAEAIRRDFVSNVSHEIRTPLTVLMGFVETMQTLELSEEERQEYLQRMASQAVRMHNLVDDLLTISRLDGRPPPDLSEWMSIKKLLQQCETDAYALSALTLGENAPHHIIFPDAAVQAQAGEIAGAAVELQSALFNLISNAVRYTPPDGDIVIDWCKLENGNARFSVQDSGPGIAPEHIPRLTERFYRVDNDRSRRSGGTGLGLAIVSRVLRRHGATLHIDSKPGHGACFAIEFPANRIRATYPT